jgi:hypothetical protein
MPLHTIMTAAKTVSRANAAFSAGAAIMTETINAVSIAVTARARTSVPNGSPMRCATTSAWYTAANTVASKTIPATAAMSPPPPTKDVIDRVTQANAGQVHAHQGVRAATIAGTKIEIAKRPTLHESIGPLTSALGATISADRASPPGRSRSSAPRARSAGCPRRG